MADEIPSLQIDTDWKKQAQEEKRKLAEKAQQAKSNAPATSAASAGASTSDALSAAGSRGTVTEARPAAFSALVQQLMTQTMLYLGEITYRGSPPMTDLDMAKYHHDLLTMLEQKTVNNLSEEEQLAIDTALHEVRTRFIRAATELLTF